MGIGSAGAALFASGLLGGTLFCVVAARVVVALGWSASLARRMDELEVRLMALSDHGAALRSASACVVASSFATDTLSLALATRPRTWLARSRPDAAELSRELSASIKTNLEAAIDAGNAIAESRKLGDPEERRSITRAVKDAGRRMTTAFWDRHGALIRGSATPERMKSLLEQFFKQVGGLKRAIADLSDEPPVSSLIQVVERVVELLNIAKAIAEEIEKIAAARPTARAVPNRGTSPQARASSKFSTSP